jgi:hypothetical protein
MDLADRNRVEVMELLATDLASDHQSGLLENPEMVHHPESGHGRQVGAQLQKALTVPFEETIKQEPPTGIVQSPKHFVHDWKQ